MTVTKVTELTAATALTDDDLLMVVDAPGGTPASKKITAAAVKTFTSVGHDTYHGIQASGAISFDATEHILTLASVTYWYAGTSYTKATPTTCDLDLTADRDHASATLTDNTLYYIYFKDATGKLYWSPVFWNLLTTVPVATVFWNGTAGSLSRETHGYSRNIDWHIWAHLTVGARYGAGLDKTYPTTTNDGSLQIETGTVYDEDVTVTTGQQTTMRGWHKPSAGAWTFLDYSLPFTGTAGAPTYLNTSTYTLTTFAANRYACYWVFATTDIDKPIAIIPSHIAAPYSQVTDARAELQPTVSGVNPEWKLIYRWIYSGDGQFIESSDYRRQASLAGAVSSATTAGAVSFAPAGNVAATTVQGAIEELDTEKVAHSLAIAENDVLVGAPTPFGSWIKKTIAEFKSILGLGSAAYTASTAYDPAGTAAGKIAASISDGDTTHAPDGNSVYDALALKANLISPSFTTPTLGTPASGTLTNCTGLPQAGVTGLTTTDSPVFGTVKLSGLADGYIPKHTSDAVGLVNSSIIDGTNDIVITKTTDWGGIKFYNESGLICGIVNNNTGGSQILMNSYESGSQVRTLSLDSRYGTIYTSGAVGVATSTPASKLSVNGNLSVGATYAAIAAPANGAIFEGNVGISCSTVQQAIVNNGNFAFYRSEGANRQIFVPVYNTVGTNTTGGGGTLWLGTGKNGFQDELSPPFDGTNIWGAAIALRGFSETNYRSSIEFFTKTGTAATAAVSRLLITHDGLLGLGTISPTALLDINSDILRLRTAKTPASASAAGNVGDICWDASYVYVCTATNTWKRSAIATWT